MNQDDRAEHGTPDQRRRRWSWLDLLLAFVPAAAAASWLGADAAVVFILGIIGILPAAWLIGQATACSPSGPASGRC